MSVEVLRLQIYKFCRSCKQSIKSNFKLIEIDLHETRDKSFVGVITGIVLK